MFKKSISFPFFLIPIRKWFAMIDLFALIDITESKRKKFCIFNKIQYEYRNAIC